MEAKEIRDLLARYYEGATSLSEEQQLRVYFEEDNVPANLQSDRNQFRAWQALRDEDFGEVLDDDRLFQKIAAQEQGADRQQQQRKQWIGRLAASVALLIVGFAGGIWYGQDTTATEVAALRDDFRSLHQTVLATQLAQASASGRIQAIQASTGSEDEAVGEALLATLATDPNVNVRLAATEALGRFSNQASVRSALATSLQQQEHPLLQIAIINQLVVWNEKNAVPELQRLVQNEEVDPVVRQQAEYGISQLLL